MVNQSSRFFARSRSASQRFLRSVVLADDRAFGEVLSAASLAVAPATADEGVAPLPSDETLVPAAANDDELHSFDAAAITRNFAREKLLATVVPISQSTHQRDAAIVAELASRADVVSLDWRVGSLAAGEFPLAVLRSVRDHDRAAGGRLRLVIIYTGDSDLVAVADQLRSFVGTKTGVGTARIDDGHTRYVVLGKPSSGSADCVDYDRLAGRIIDEFAQFTAGLLSNMALRCFAELRDRTHLVLATIPSELDAAYLSHRVHCSPVDAAAGFILDLLIDECGSLLRDANVESEVGDAAVQERLDIQSADQLSISLIDKPDCTGSVSLPELLSDGIENVRSRSFSGLSKDQQAEWKRQSHRQVTSLFARRLGVNSDADIDLRFAVFSTQVTNQTLDPVLTLGTIVEQISESDNSVLVCLQPRCDAVRVPAKKGWGFVFVPVVSDQQEFDLVVCRENGTFFRGRLQMNATKLRHISFAGDEHSKVVRSTARVFCDVERREYRYLGQLKDGVSQRFANELAAKLARVGVDTFEWLRRSEPRGRK